MIDRRATQPVAVLQQVSFHYPAGPELLSNVDLEIRPGQLVLLTGPNGCGKSTLLGLLTGRLRPRTGNVRVLRDDPARVDRLPQVGLITEPFHPVQSPLPANMSTDEILQWLEILDGVSRPAAEAVLDRLGLPPRLFSQPIRSLSKGERQRVMLLVVLLRKPRLILADEPLEGLDAESREKISANLHAFTQTGGSVLWISHHAAECLRYADRLLTLDGKQLVEAAADRYRIMLDEPGEPSQPVNFPTLDLLPAIASEALARRARIRFCIEESR